MWLNTEKGGGSHGFSNHWTVVDTPLLCGIDFQWFLFCLAFLFATQRKQKQNVRCQTKSKFKVFDDKLSEIKHNIHMRDARKFTFIHSFDQYAISNMPFTVIHYGHSCVIHKQTHTHAQTRTRLGACWSHKKQYKQHILHLRSVVHVNFYANRNVFISNHVIWFLFTVFSVRTSGNIFSVLLWNH